MTTRARRIASPLLGLALLAAWLFLLWPASLGGPATWIVIRGDSMEPVYRTGDLVIVRAAETYALGDIVAYRVPAGEIGAGHVVIHRLTGGDPVHGFEATGDNNGAPDPWHPTASSIVGRDWILLPGVGRIIAWMRQPVVLAGLAAAVVVAWIVGRPSGTAPRPGVLAAQPGICGLGAGPASRAQ